MGHWTNKVVVVTGASSGLGRSLAEAFSAEGARVVLAARNADNLAIVERSLRDAGREAFSLSTDVTVQEQVERLMSETLERYGQIDVLVNSAGRSTRGKVLDTTPDEFTRLLDLNFLGAVRCTRAAVPHLLRRRGHVVNIGSLASKVATRYVGAYPVSKFALAAYNQQLRMELGPQGLHVLLVCPGPIKRADVDASSDASRYAAEAKGLPEKARRPGAGVKLAGIPPERLAKAVLRACRKRRAELIYPWRARMFFALAQLSPRLGDWLLRQVS